MKKILSLFAFGLMLMTLVACSDAEISKESSMPKENEEVTVVSADGEAEKQEKKEAEVGMRTNPVKPGETVYITKEVHDFEKDLSAEAEFEVTVSNFIRGQEATDILMAENEFNEPAPDGYEWVLFDITLNATIADDNLSYYVMPAFYVFSEDGSPIANDESIVVPNRYGLSDIYNGGTMTGKMAIMAPVGEDVLVEYSDMDFGFFFTTKSE